MSKLQDGDSEAQKIRDAEFEAQRWEDIDEMLYYQDLFYVPKIICSEVISCYHDDPLAGHFEIDKTRELIARKYYWPTLRRDVKTYLKGCDMCLASKAVCHKLNGDIQLFLVSTHREKDLSIDFVTSLLVFTD